MEKFISSLLMIILIQTPFELKAQKLPAQQTVTAALPSMFKIDGLAKEWDDKFQAHNNNTDVNYSMANNGQFLYLAVQATDATIMKKIIGGGITWTINTSGQRADPAPFSLTFPLVADNFQLSVFSTINDITLFSNQTSKDSVVKTANDKIRLSAKEIRLKGFESVADSMLSIYNATGIKSAALVNTKGALTCEFLVPLKLLGISPHTQKLIMYNVMLNATTSIKTVSRGGGITVTSVPRSMSTQSSSTRIAQYPTDFWATYPIK